MSYFADSDRQRQIDLEFKVSWLVDYEGVARDYLLDDVETKLNCNK
ncbi:hypothetical protein [Nostoc sp. UHCC 0251]|nr:hypothetical protein [Nostoc sp. UHCC 0251]MEA5623941.1 hypothetical protein [Nostoc sp. UHCC 0251]